MKKLLLALLVVAHLSYADIAVHEFDSPQQEAQYQGLINEFRCPTCQNQNLAGSDAPIAKDLKQKTYEMVKDGRSDSEIRAFMLERYGDFISYKPPVRPSTWILWFFPPVLMMGLLFFWVFKNKKPKTQIAQTIATTLSDDEERQLKALLATHKNLNANKNQSVSPISQKDNA